VLWVEGQVLSPFDGMLPLSDEIRVGFKRINCGDIELTNVYMEKVTENFYVYWSRGGLVGTFVLIARISKANICEQNKFVLNYKYCVFEFRMWYGLFCYGCLLWVFVMVVSYGCLLWVFVVGVCYGCLLWLFVMGVCYGCLLWVFVMGVCCGCLLWVFVE
jgi:hypothetical protein